MKKNEIIFVSGLYQKSKSLLLILMMFTFIIFFNSCQSDDSDIIINPEIGYLPKVFDENKNEYSFSGELKAKFDRFKSKGEIKKWEVGRLNSEISFTLEMKYILNIFEKEFEFEITEVSYSTLFNLNSYWASIRGGGVILMAGKDNEYGFHIWYGENIYRVEWLGEGFHLIEELDRSVIQGGD